MAGHAIFVPAALTGPQIMLRIRQFTGLGSGFDADLVRGRGTPTDAFRFDLAPAFSQPPGFGEIVAQSLWGV